MERCGKNQCPICFDEHKPDERTCEDWMRYWESLTSEQRSKEERMMANYSIENEMM